MASDTSNIEEMEQKLIESELNFRELFEVVNDVLFIFDTKGRITSVNKSFERMIGYPKEMFIGKSLVSLVTKEYLDPMLDIFPKVIQQGETVSGEIGFITKNGKIRYVSFTSKPIYSGDKVVGILGVAKDTTKLKKLKEMIHADRHLVKSVICAFKDPIILADLEGNVKQVNKEFLNAFCYSEGEVMGKSTYHIFPIKSADIKRYNDLMTDVLTKDHVSPIEMEVVAKDGRKLFISLIASLIKNTNDKPVSILIQIGVK